MNQIILVDKLKSSVSIGGLQVSIYNNNPHIELLSIEDKYINHFAMHIGINLFENNRESLNIIESYSNKLGIAKQIKSLYNYFLNFINDQMIVCISETGIVEKFIDVDVYPENKVVLNNEKDIIAMLNIACKDTFALLQEDVYYFLEIIQTFFNYTLTYKTAQEFLCFKHTHPNMKIIPNRIYNSNFGSMYIVTDLNSDVYKSYEIEV